MEILEVPFPALNQGQVLVRNHYSVISAGTEGKTVSDARKGYIAKARSRQKEVQQVINLVKTQGFKETYKMVMNKLDAPAALGYSTSGEVIAVADNITEFKVGDFVACGGASASHADIIAVPKNLCVKLPNKDFLKQAAFTTIASIAIQGVRQAELKFGEKAVVIGLGLIGQITVSILNASGIQAIGVDLDSEKVQLAKQSGIEAYNRDTEGLEHIIKEAANRHGADAVLITAGTSSLDPVNFAGEITRPKGKVVIVGAVPTGFDRKNYYRKELDLRMSCSYGPGRYDANFEEKGIDYPIGYVRWTEKRNMETFIDFLYAQKINIQHLISHEFDLENASEAYNLILSKQENVTGIVLKYNQDESIQKDITIPHQKEFSPSEPNIGMVGAGSFAQNMLLPRMKGLYNFIGIATARGNTSKYAGTKYGFTTLLSDSTKLISSENINTIFITTRHHLHAQQVKEAITHNKHVFIEKPLCLKETELNEIKKLVENGYSKNLMLGFNRRFSPLTKEILKAFPTDSPVSINMRINAGMVPPEHWVHDPEIGGGRILGEACHFIDLAAYLSKSTVEQVFATELKSAAQLQDTVNINLYFKNGSTANISYFSNGNKSLPKEYIELFSAGQVAIIDDFKRLTLYGKKVKKIKLKEQDKGHTNELKAFAESIRKATPSPIPFDQIYNSTLATFKVIESIQNHRAIHL